MESRQETIYEYVRRSNTTSCEEPGYYCNLNEHDTSEPISKR